jgi:hypothetical protein
MARRTLIKSALISTLGASLVADTRKPLRILLRSSWQTVNTATSDTLLLVSCICLSNIFQTSG